jgi:hypothetical protein
MKINFKKKIIKYIGQKLANATITQMELALEHDNKVFFDFCLDFGINLIAFGEIYGVEFD